MLSPGYVSDLGIKGLTSKQNHGRWRPSRADQQGLLEQKGSLGLWTSRLQSRKLGPVNGCGQRSLGESLLAGAAPKHSAGSFVALLDQMGH